MRICVLVGADEAGGVHLIGGPLAGGADELRSKQREIENANGAFSSGKKKLQFVKTWLDDVTAGCLRSRSCYRQAAGVADSGDE